MGAHEIDYDELNEAIQTVRACSLSALIYADYTDGDGHIFGGDFLMNIYEQLMQVAEYLESISDVSSTAGARASGISSAPGNDIRPDAAQRGC